MPLPAATGHCVRCIVGRLVRIVSAGFFVFVAVSLHDQYDPLITNRFWILP